MEKEEEKNAWEEMMRFSHRSTYICPDGSIIVPYCLFPFSRQIMGGMVLHHRFAVLQIEERFLIEGVNVRYISEYFNIDLRSTVLDDGPEIFLDDRILLSAP